VILRAWPLGRLGDRGYRTDRPCQEFDTRVSTCCSVREQELAICTRARPGPATAICLGTTTLSGETVETRLDHEGGVPPSAGPSRRRLRLCRLGLIRSRSFLLRPSLDTYPRREVGHTHDDQRHQDDEPDCAIHDEAEDVPLYLSVASLLARLSDGQPRSPPLHRCFERHFPRPLFRRPVSPGTRS
jgi:hypothetical protein